MRPVVLLRASTGSPASPTGLVGKVPPSVKVAPPSTDRANPVNLLVPPELEPESLKPTTTVLPNATIEVSLWVKRPTPVDPALLLVREFTGEITGTSPSCRGIRPAFSISRKASKSNGPKFCSDRILAGTCFEGGGS